jgi:hypothetical protein
MKNYVDIPCDLYIHKTDLSKLDKGDSAIGYIKVSNPAEYELVPKYAFIPLAIKVNDNAYSVCTINE